MSDFVKKRVGRKKKLEKDPLKTLQKLNQSLKNLGCVSLEPSTPRKKEVGSVFYRT